MRRHCPLVGVVLFGTLAVLAGCHPQQPFYLYEDGDLSHYLGVATEIEYPDVEVESLADAAGALPPFSLLNPPSGEPWDLSLEEAIQCALANGKVLRSLGGQLSVAPDMLLRSPMSVATVYDPAIMESSPLEGVEAALSAFDTQFASGVFWEKNDTPRNVPSAGAINEEWQGFLVPVYAQDLGTFQAQLSKTAATGGTWTLRHNVVYDQSPGLRLYPSDWNVNLEAEFRQPLLQGAGVQINRIAGPGATPGSNYGVMIARIKEDVSLADFEAGVRNMVFDLEKAYWGLYYAYRHLDAMHTWRDASLDFWRTIYRQFTGGTRSSLDEAQARDDYLLAEDRLERALNDLFLAESNLRYMMGLAATDGRLIRPSDEPTPAAVRFDWCEVLSEGLARSAELRRQKWTIKQRELELTTAKNHLLPTLDAVGRYRWLGLGDDLIQSSGGTGDPSVVGSNAYQSMTSGNFQEWQLGLELSFAIGSRKEMAGVRHAQLNLARERARLQEQELELSHQLADAIRQLEAAHELSRKSFNRRVAAKKLVELMPEAYQGGRVTVDRVLDARRRLADAEDAYYRSLVSYSQQIAAVHYRKGSLLEYNNVYLSEGPWPGKAYFDARRHARARDAGLYVDYGYTRPKVISRGAYQQQVGGGVLVFDQGEGEPERIPTPAPEPLEVPAELPAPAGGLGQPMGPEPAALERDASAADGAQIGPALGLREDAAAQPAVRQAGVDLAHGVSLLGSDKPAGEAAGGPSTGVGRWSAVKPTGGSEPVQQARMDDTGQAAAEAAPLKWSNLETLGSRHETHANSPAAEIDRAASGWEGVQR